MARPTLPSLAALALAGVLAAAPACTRTRPVTTPSASSDASVLTAASSSPAAESTFAPAASPSAAPTPVDDDGPRKVATAPPVLATPRATLPPATAPGVGTGPTPPAGTARPMPVPTATPVVPTPQPPQQTIVDAIDGRGELATLAQALRQAGLEATLRDRTQVYTVFAPSNQAFEALPDGTFESLMREENRGRLAKILKYHVLPGRIESQDLRARTYPTLDLTHVKVTLEPPAIKVDGSGVQTADVRAGNGVVHVIGSVLTPPDLAPEADSVVALAAKRADLTTLVRALDSAGLVEALRGPGPFTVFAPTNRAFDKLPAGAVTKLLQADNLGALQTLLKYHVVNGKVSSGQLRDGGLPTINGMNLPVVVTGQPTPRVGGGGVALADLFAGNGIVHLIDTVAIPPGFQLP